MRDVQATVARLRARENALCAGVLKWSPRWTDAALVASVLPTGDWDNTTTHTLLGGTMAEAMQRAIDNWNDPEWIAEQGRVWALSIVRAGR